jgi:PhnB protein
MANPIPAGTTSITPHLIVRNAPAALEFYARAFGATEVLRMQGPDGSIVYAEMQNGNARVYLAEENPKMGAPSPQGLGGSPAQA